MLNRKLLLAVVAVGLAGVAHAGGQNDAGCGIGSLMFKDDKPAMQILAATFNGSFGSQTFGITTGTLGCSSGGLIKAGKEREVFVATNLRSLEREMAAGKGQYVSSLAALSGCTSAPEKFLSFSKANYEKIFTGADASAKTVIENLDRAMASDKALMQACGA